MEVLKYPGSIVVEMKDAAIAGVMRHALTGLPFEFYIRDKTIFAKIIDHSSAVSSEGLKRICTNIKTLNTLL